MEWLKKNWTILCAAATLVAGWTTMNYRLDAQDIAINKLESRQNSTDLILSDINKQLADMNAKLSLIVEGKVTFVLGGDDKL